MFSVNASSRRGNLDKEEEPEGIRAEARQLFWISEENVGSVSHICSNRNGLDGFRSNGLVSSKIGQ